MEMSARFCQGWRKMLRWPLEMKLVSNVSPLGIAEHGKIRRPAADWRRECFARIEQRYRKQDALRAGEPGIVADRAGEPRSWRVQPGGSNGTMGLVIPS